MYRRLLTATGLFALVILLTLYGMMLYIRTNEPTHTIAQRLNYTQRSLALNYTTNHKQDHTTLKDMSLKGLLLVMVQSAPGNKERRDLIRETWMNSYVKEKKKFMVKFVIGTFGLNNYETSSLTSEQDKFNDLLFLTNLKDSYKNLTRKTLSMFEWANKNTRYSYILKTDDDSFPKLDQIELELSTRSVDDKPLYWGMIAYGFTPHTKGKWKETDWTLCQTYLPYALGAGYVLSRSLIHKIAINADMLMLYHNEDMSVGTWISPFNLERNNDNRFCTTQCSMTKKVCKTQLLLHFLSIEDIKKSHQLMTSKGVLC